MRRRSRTALHEAGHAVMAHLAGRRLGAMSTVPRSDVLGQLDYRGFVSFPAHALEDARTRRKLESEIMIALAGLAAESLRHRRVDRAGAAPDLERAFAIASSATPDPHEATAYINWLFIRARNRLRDRRCARAIDALAAELLRRGSLTGPQARAIIARSLRRR